MKGELTPEEINVNSIGMFRAGVDTVNAQWATSEFQKPSLSK